MYVRLRCRIFRLLVHPQHLAKLDHVITELTNCRYDRCGKVEGTREFPLRPSTIGLQLDTQLGNFFKILRGDVVPPLPLSLLRL